MFPKHLIFRPFVLLPNLMATLSLLEIISLLSNLNDCSVNL